MNSVLHLAAAWSAGVAASLSAAPAPSRPSGPEPDDPLARAVEDIGRSSIGAGTRALVVVVDVGGERVLSRGFGRARTGEAPTGDTEFHAGPLLSSFLSVAALAQAGEGRLDLQAPLSERFPDLPYGGLGVRVDQLLTHTSGIPSYGELLRAGRSARPEPERVLAWLRNGPLDSMPGTCASYSSTDDLLLGLLLQDVAGESVAALLERSVFTAAGMEDTAFGCGLPADPTARVEQEFAGAFEDQDGVPGPFDAGVLCSTAHDLVRFQRALVDGRLLPKSALELRATPARLADGSTVEQGRGVALTRAGEWPRQSCGGSTGGERAQLVYYPALDATLVVWASGEDAPVQRVAEQVARALLELEEPRVLDLPTTSEQRALHVGDYYAGCICYAVMDEGEHLVLYPPEGPRTVLLHQGGESFVARDDPDLRLEFERDDGQIIAFVLTSHGAAERARRLY